MKKKTRKSILILIIMSLVALSAFAADTAEVQLNAIIDNTLTGSFSTPVISLMYRLSPTSVFSSANPNGDPTNINSGIKVDSTDTTNTVTTIYCKLVNAVKVNRANTGSFSVDISVSNFRLNDLASNDSVPNKHLPTVLSVGNIFTDIPSVFDDNVTSTWTSIDDQHKKLTAVYSLGVSKLGLDLGFFEISWIPSGDLNPGTYTSTVEITLTSNN